MAGFDIQRIPERFRGLGLISFLANGSVGKVYFVHDVFNQRKYALKEINCEGSITKFRNAQYEIDVMKRLAHVSGVVPIVDSEIVEDGDSGTVYILEAYHIPFVDYLKENQLTVRDKVNMLAELCGTLSQCRDAGVLHLDLQLRNLFVDPEGKILLGDFSSALLLKDLDKNKAMRGTLAYMAPEVYRNGQCSERSDIYTVGMVLHHVVAPELFPSVRWEGDELSVYKRLAGAPLYGEARENESLCEELRRVVGYTCAFAPEDRPESFEQLQEILSDLAKKAEEVRLSHPKIKRPLIRKVLNVIYIVQTSGAMTGEPIQEINSIGRETLQMLRKMQIEYPNIEIRTSVLSFGGETVWHQVADELDGRSLWPELKAGGLSHLSDALRELERKFSSSQLISGTMGVYTPVIIFMINGCAYERYDPELTQLKQNPWFRNAVKLAIAVDDVNDYSNIEKIIGNREAILKKKELSMLPELLRPVSLCKSVCLSSSVSPIIQHADYIGTTCAILPPADTEPNWDEQVSENQLKQDKAADAREALRQELLKGSSVIIDADGRIVLPQTGFEPVSVIDTDNYIQVPDGRLAGGPVFVYCRVCGEEVHPSATYCPNCGSKLNIEKPAVDIRQVQFSATAPKMFIKGEYSLIDVFMYEEAFRSVVEEAKQDSDVPLQEKKGRSMQVGTGASVRVVLTSPDVQIDDNDQEATWDGGYLTFSFPVLLPRQYPKRQMLFTASVYINQIIATKLTFTAKCTSFFEQKIAISRNDYLSAFVSYASQDRRKVAAIIQGMKKARPEMDIFFDVDSLRSGEDWEGALQREIDGRDILYLCWSRAARDSAWVDREWRYAYSQKGAECIDPVAIDPPEICPPPKELSKKHFNDRLLSYINTEFRRLKGSDVWETDW